MFPNMILRFSVFFYFVNHILAQDGFGQKCFDLNVCNDDPMRDCMLTDSLLPHLRPRHLKWAKNVCGKGFQTKLWGYGFFLSSYEKNWFDGCCRTCCKLLSDRIDKTEFVATTRKTNFSYQTNDDEDFEKGSGAQIFDETTNTTFKNKANLTSDEMFSPKILKSPLTTGKPENTTIISAGKRLICPKNIQNMKKVCPVLLQKLESQMDGKCRWMVNARKQFEVCLFRNISLQANRRHNIGFYNFNSTWNEQTKTLTMPGGDYCGRTNGNKTGQIQFVCSQKPYLQNIISKVTEPSPCVYKILWLTNLVCNANKTMAFMNATAPPEVLSTKSVEKAKNCTELACKPGMHDGDCRLMITKHNQLIKKAKKDDKLLSKICWTQRNVDASFVYPSCIIKALGCCERADIRRIFKRACEKL